MLSMLVLSIVVVAGSWVAGIVVVSIVVVVVVVSRTATLMRAESKCRCRRLVFCLLDSSSRSNRPAATGLRYLIDHLSRRSRWSTCFVMSEEGVCLRGLLGSPESVACWCREQSSLLFFSDMQIKREVAVLGYMSCSDSASQLAVVNGRQ